MTLNDTPTANRIQIGLFGRTNAGKSSLVNALTGQSLAIVSAQPGTTTDPVRKAMELLPLGPVIMIDTPGLDDFTALGEQRRIRSLQTLSSIDIGMLVIDVTSLPLTQTEYDLLKEFSKRQIPYLIVLTKLDLIFSDCAKSTTQSVSATVSKILQQHPCLRPYQAHLIAVSAVLHYGINDCKEALGAFQKDASSPVFITDQLSCEKPVILVVPIDRGAPKGRIILPQQQVLRELLEAGIVTMVVRETELSQALSVVEPQLVITDSQVFGIVSRILPASIPLTSFSILMARAKGNLKQAVAGAFSVDTLKDHDHILISEGCTHHRQCDDIGTVKLPAWLKEYTGKDLHFSWTSGREFPEDLAAYQLVIHCGGCMLNSREMQSRYLSCQTQGIAVTNYGIVIAHMRGILKRSIAVLGEF